MELNVIETNRFFSTESGGHSDHKIGTQSDRKSQKSEVMTAETPYHAQLWEYPMWKFNRQKR